MGHRERALISFAAYVSRDSLFCAYAGPKQPSAVTLAQIKTYLLDSAPSSIVVDDPRGFFEQTTVWLLWLVERAALDNGKDIARGLARGAWRKDVVDRLRDDKGGASKELVLQAREAGIDLADLSAVLRYLESLRPGDASWSEFCREFCDPPHPIFDRGRILYAHRWPPVAGADA